MGNSSFVTSFVLTAFYDMTELKYMYFFIFLVLYIAIILINFIVIGVTWAERTLHEPMYFFVSTLAVNELYGSTALLPSLLNNLLCNGCEVPVAWCQVQIFCLHTYAIIEFTVLAVMSYDRYVAICYPLQYHTIMSWPKVFRLILFSWFYPFLAFAVLFALTVQLTFCDRFVDKVYCANYSLVKLSCVNTAVVNFAGLLSVPLYTLPQLITTLYSYAHILKVCFFSSRKGKVKALQTCTPHLFALVNYSVGCFFEIAQSRLNLTYLSYETRIFMSLYFLIFPPILNPVIYGITLHAMRVQILKRFMIRSKIVPKQLFSTVS